MKNSVVMKIIKLNVFVYFLWVIYGAVAPEFMIRNFLVSPYGVAEGRVWTLLTSVFSHNLFFHLLLNMLVLYSFGRVMERVMGPSSFLRFYLLAGLFGSLGHIIVSVVFLQDSGLPALGASGAVSGVLLLFALLYPKEKIFLFGLIPLPALWAALLFMGIDVWGVVVQTRGSDTPIGHGAHLGGAVMGLFYYLLNWHRHRPVPFKSHFSS